MKKTMLTTLYLSLVTLIVGMTWLERRNHTPLHTKNTLFKKEPFIPSDSWVDLRKNWGLTSQASEKLQQVWTTVPCNQKVTVAVIDTGIDQMHPALKNSLWKNPNEIENNGIDDDSNGYIDDVYGWDFVEKDALPQDEHGHGTHVSGIIAGISGSSQTCSKVSLMILKYYDAQASGQKNLENTIKAFRYAVQQGAQIINYSGGGSEYSELERTVLSEAQKKGILLVAAAGNERQNTDIYGYYPASYDLPNIISVAAITRNKKLVASSNYGLENVDIAAPGKNIYSTLPNYRYGHMTGTSQAAAYVTGLASLTLAMNPSLSADELKALLIQHIIPIKSLSGKIKRAGTINVQEVVETQSINAVETSVER